MWWVAVALSLFIKLGGCDLGWKAEHYRLQFGTSFLIIQVKQACFHEWNIAHCTCRWYTQFSVPSQTSLKNDFCMWICVLGCEFNLRWKAASVMWHPPQNKQGSSQELSKSEFEFVCLKMYLWEIILVKQHHQVEPSQSVDDVHSHSGLHYCLKFI